MFTLRVRDQVFEDDSWKETALTQSPWQGAQNWAVENDSSLFVTCQCFGSWAAAILLRAVFVCVCVWTRAAAWIVKNDATITRHVAWSPFWFIIPHSGHLPGEPLSTVTLGGWHRRTLRGDFNIHSQSPSAGCYNFFVWASSWAAQRPKRFPRPTTTALPTRLQRNPSSWIPAQRYISF